MTALYADRDRVLTLAAVAYMANFTTVDQRFSDVVDNHGITGADIAERVKLIGDAMAYLSIFAVPHAPNVFEAFRWVSTNTFAQLDVPTRAQALKETVETAGIYRRMDDEERRIECVSTLLGEWRHIPESFKAKEGTAEALQSETQEANG